LPSFLRNVGSILADRSEIMAAKLVECLQNWSIHFMNPVGCQGLQQYLTIEQTACNWHLRIVGFWKNMGGKVAREQYIMVVISIIIMVIIIVGQLLSWSLASLAAECVSKCVLWRWRMMLLEYVWVSGVSGIGIVIIICLIIGKSSLLLSSLLLVSDCVARLLRWGDGDCHGGRDCQKACHWLLLLLVALS